ncbi:hypothetical protein [Micromonospora sp. IBHARD004]|uniref:hypothetical protein n=1 Tax=Micromonospora sp. IBHARD004 TaxID=3457764 RepID=UPI0040596F3D
MPAEVVRVGDTVRRTPPANAGFVAALLRHPDRAGVGLAPRCDAVRHSQEWLRVHRATVEAGVLA